MDRCDVVSFWCCNAYFIACSNLNSSTFSLKKLAKLEVIKYEVLRSAVDFTLFSEPELLLSHNLASIRMRPLVAHVLCLR